MSSESLTSISEHLQTSISIQNQRQNAKDNNNNNHSISSNETTIIVLKRSRSASARVDDSISSDSQQTTITTASIKKNALLLRRSRSTSSLTLDENFSIASSSGRLLQEIRKHIIDYRSRRVLSTKQFDLEKRIKSIPKQTMKSICNKIEKNKQKINQERAEIMVRRRMLSRRGGEINCEKDDEFEEQLKSLCENDNGQQLLNRLRSVNSLNAIKKDYEEKIQNDFKIADDFLLQRDMKLNLTKRDIETHYLREKLKKINQNRNRQLAKSHDLHFVDSIMRIGESAKMLHELHHKFHLMNLLEKQREEIQHLKYD